MNQERPFSGKEAVVDGGEEMSDAAGRNSQKKARTFDLDAMLAETTKVAQERSSENKAFQDAQAGNKDDSSWLDLPTGFGSSKSMQACSSTNASLGSQQSTYDLTDDDDDFGPALPPDFVPDTSVMVGSSEEQDDDYEDFEGDGIPIVKLIPTSCEATLQHGSKPVSAARFEPLGQRFSSGGLDYQLKLFDFQKMDMSLRPDKEVSPCESHVINSLCFSPNGETLIVCSGEANIRLFGRDGEQWAETNKGDQYLVDVANTKGHTAAVNCCVWNNFSKEEFLTCSDDGTVRIWTLADYKELSKAINKHVKLMKTKTANGKRAMPQTCCYSPDGKMIAAGCDDGSIQAWRDGRFVQPFYIVRNAHKGPVTSLCFSPDSKRLLSRGLDDSMRLWSLTDTKKPLKELTGLENAFKSTDCGFSPRGELVYTGTSCPRADQAGQLLFYNAETLELVYKIDFPGVSVLRIDWHPRINQILTTFSDGTIKIFYDQQLSQRGVLQCITKPVRRSRAKEVVREEMILSPLALEMFQPRGEEGEEKEVTHARLKKYMRMRDNQLRPEFRKPADIPMDGPSANGRVAASGSTLHSYLAKQIGTQRNKEFLEDTDIRTAILRHADEAAANPMYIDKAYKRNQPHAIFQEKTTAPEEEEKDTELQPLFKMPRLG